MHDLQLFVFILFKSREFHENFFLAPDTFDERQKMREKYPSFNVELNINVCYTVYILRTLKK